MGVESTARKTAGHITISHSSGIPIASSALHELICEGLVVHLAKRSAKRGG